MNILYLADPNSIHDIRWLNFICRQTNNNCFVICRVLHYKAYLNEQSKLDKNIPVLAAVADPSTVQPWRNLWQAIKIRRLIGKYQIDILHIMYAEPNALWAMFKPFFGVPVVVTTHGTDILKTIPSFFEKKTLFSSMVAFQYRRALNRVDHFTCTSRRQMEILSGLKIRRPVSLVRTGVDLELIKTSNLDMAALLGIKKPFVLMPRNMKPIYNHELTLGAIALLGQSIREKFSFVFINADTADRDYFQEVQEKARTIDTTIHFCPSVTHQEIISLSKQASLVLMNPFSDGSPVTAMEAMACKVPVVLPPLRYDEEVFGNVFCFDEWHPVSLKNKIEYVLTMKHEDLMAINEVNFLNILRHGNIAIELDKVYRLYHELTGFENSDLLTTDPSPNHLTDTV